MNLTSRYTCSFLTSLIIHLIVLFLISFNILPEYLKMNKEIKVILIKTPVSKPLGKGEKKIEHKLTNNEKKQSVVKKNTQRSENIERPIVNMPAMDLDEKIEIDSPKYNISQSNELKNLKISSLNALNKEIEQIQKNLGSSKTESINTEVMDDDFFELRSLSNKNRRLVYIPEKKGAFKLETNTNLILSFNIDKSGTPYNITFVNRSFSEIENIALNFVKQLRFEAVDYDSVDKAEIVLHFKVK